ncbi:hypothetical protein EDD37DRAFT_13215 [Exophiala viscosa]|uniref:Uncharacterized protein n=1 Tax=Exophiala viscosa TaxID=2486360 RepID=A0AAN6IAW3_9EURO|nr:hypothetical protein EDD36DRAFT_330745 [Exophiala viscosa]KAI1628582.1 hypothetical protein EDD37DRAFT_13215 [Exophiala viscosa]
MSKPIPVIILGKIPADQSAVTEALKPEYEVVKIFESVEALADGLPALLESPDRKPAGAFMGGIFTPEEFAAARAVPGASSFPWMRPIRTKPGNEHMMTPAHAPPPDMLAALARNSLDTHEEMIKERKGAGEVWYY